VSTDAPISPSSWKTILAFAILYFVWGSTFLAVRIGVRDVPPFMFAAMRFLLAGLFLVGLMVLRGEPNPTRQQWTSISLLALLIFVGDYGLMFWAQQRVPSGSAAVMMATIPVFLALFEICILRTRKLDYQLLASLLFGTGGVCVLMSSSLGRGDIPIDRAGAAALLVGAFNWSAASTLARRLPLPSSKVMSSGSQMLVGGLLLSIAAGAMGEFHGFQPGAVSRGGWEALAYLTIGGSIIGFTAFVWLIHRESPVRVGTYAYVNPVVAVFLGYALGGEALGPRTVGGAFLIIVSVVLITVKRGTCQKTCNGTE
jgi:drug/metabolite transporter (DMT)-like permease